MRFYETDLYAIAIFLKEINANADKLPWSMNEYFNSEELECKM